MSRRDGKELFLKLLAARSVFFLASWHGDATLLRAMIASISMGMWRIDEVRCLVGTLRMRLAMQACRRIILPYLTIASRNGSVNPNANYPLLLQF